MPYDVIIGRTEADKQRFGKEGLVYIGKGYVQMGTTSSLSNPILMDVARSHVVLISGKRGSGKCLHGDTLIALEDGRNIPIRDLEENENKILSLNEDLKMALSPKENFFKRQVNKLIKLRLRSGKEIKLTPEHPLFTIKGWKAVSDLTIGSRIATPRTLPVFGNSPIPNHEIKLLAYLIAEGHTKKVVLFSNSDEKIINDFEESLNEFDTSLRLIKEKKDHYRISDPNWKNKILDQKEILRDDKGQFKKGTKVLHKKRSIREFIEKYGLFEKLAIEKTIPQKIMTLEKQKLALFLNRLFSCDGSIYKHKAGKGQVWEISYSSSSEKLIKQVQHLLLRFGILARLRKKNVKYKDQYFKSFELVMGTNNVIKFINSIGFFGEKEKKIDEALNKIKGITRNPNVDTIPKEIWDTYKPKNWAEIGRAVGYKHPKAMRERIRYAPSRQTLLQIARVEQNQGLHMLATSDIFWDQIISLEILEGDFTVYDISVPEHHNFVANDIIVHNSYTLGVIAEEMASLPDHVGQNIATLIFDTMGIFWTMTYPNEKETSLLKNWGLKSKKLPISVFVPLGYAEKYRDMGIPVTKGFAFKANELTADDWNITFGLGMLNPVSIAIQRAIAELSEKKKDYDLDVVINTIREDKEATHEAKSAAINLFEAAKTWGIFVKKGEKGTAIAELIEGGQTSVLDLSTYSSTATFNVRALVIGLITKKLFQERSLKRKKEEIDSVKHRLEYLRYKEKREMPLVWLMIDELHEFLPEKGKTPATDALIQLIREGRQPGISLVGATQQPGKVHTDIWTQSDIVISHRLTAKPDVTALSTIMQSYLTDDIQAYMNQLPDLKGSAIILDDNSERIYPMRMRARFTWHGGESPTSIKVQKRV